MKFDNIKSIICNIINSRYEIDDSPDLANELLSLADEELKHKEILRLRRLGVKVDTWKTIALVEIESEKEVDIKIELKKAITWIATLKETLLGIESTDLYLFLAFNAEISKEECLRIESTEQFCRKYVLLPDENILEFVNRTFLQKLVSDSGIIDGEDPLERAFDKTASQFNWLTPEMKEKWKKAFSELSGIELSDALLNGGDVK